MPDGHAVCSRLGDLYGEGVVVSTLRDGMYGLGRFTSHCAWAARSELGMYEGEFRRSKLTWHLRNEVSHGGLRPEFIRCWHGWRAPWLLCRYRTDNQLFTSFVHYLPDYRGARAGGQYWWRDLGRSEERRVGKECVSTCRSGWSPYH